VAPTISALRRRSDEIVERLLRENRPRWESLSNTDGERLEAMAREVAARLLHEPSVRLAKARGEDSSHYERALQELFDLGHRPLAKR
jgi:glutamyl-tRNA reductase